MRIPWLDPQRRRSIALATVVLSLAGWVLAPRNPRPLPVAAVKAEAPRASVRFEGRGMWGRLSAAPSRIAAGARKAVSVELRIRAVQQGAVSDVELALRLPPRARVLGVWGAEASDVLSRVRIGSLAPDEERTAIVDLEIDASAAGDAVEIDATVSFRPRDAAREEIALPPLRIDVVAAGGERLGAR